MSRPQELQIKNLCHKPETVTRAQVLLHTAIATTGQGSGHELGNGSIGLAAICAYIASLELGNGDVSEKMAHAASCLAPKVFKTTLNVVRAALAASASHQRAATVEVTYETLMQRAKFTKRVDFMLSCVRSVEWALVASRELPDEFQPPCDAVTIAVFCWTCTDLLGAKKIQPIALLRDYAVPQRDYDDILHVLKTSCGDIAENIKQKKLELSKGSKVAKTPQTTPSREATRTPSARSPTKSPRKSALRGTDTMSSPSKTPTHKRKVAFSDGPDSSDMDMDMDTDSAAATPSKRPKLTSPTKPSPAPAYYRSPAKPRAFPSAPAASSSRTTLDLLRPAEEDAGEDSDDIDAHFPAIPSTPSTPASSDTSARSTPRSMTRRAVARDEPLRPRRFRPVFLEHKQWLQRDPRIEREWKAAEALIRSVVERYGG
ncbi:hypothetical protein B0H21DRAFT_785059, partial [Amylocystis lapponica]